MHEISHYYMSPSPFLKEESAKWIFFWQNCEFYHSKLKSKHKLRQTKLSQFVYFSLVLREPEETKTKYSTPYRFQVFHTYDYTSQLVNNWTILEICMLTIHFQLQQCEILLVRLHLMRILPILAWHIQVCNVLVYTVTDYYLCWATSFPQIFSSRQFFLLIFPPDR